VSRRRRRPGLRVGATRDGSSDRAHDLAPAEEATAVDRPSSAGIGTPRPRAGGKFLFVGDEKLYVRGATYGTFRPRGDDCEFPEPETVDRDIALMAENGLNAFRTYTPPPRWLLDRAAEHGMHVMVGLPAERYIGYLADGRSNGDPDVADVVREGVAGCAGHPAVLCYAVGNEIPAAVARWHDRGRVARFLEQLYRAAKAEDPEGLVTYVNYPSTEYLDLPFLDLLCYNVFLESRRDYDAYLARLQNVAGDRPLLMTEVGLDSLRNGEEAQARSLDWQVRTSFEAGCAGVFVYSWTDEWYRSGEDVHDWAFGLTRRDREPKPALTAVSEAFGAVPFAENGKLPRISVIVCTYNGAQTLAECLAGLERVEYPDYEVIVVDDGSRDGSAAIADRFDCRVIRTPNHGLSSARNTGLAAATGDIVAYIDDDAYPDPHWLAYLAAAFRRADHAGIGGPNIAPPGDGFLAECVTNAPGNPVHVLLTDQVAEHIPGCNMAFRKSALEAVGGFDTQFRVAGDDIDVCWKIQEAGGTLGFSAAAMVWHHRRGELKTYWRQQLGYGRAEAAVERKWPAKFGPACQVAWGGRLYGRGLSRTLGWSRGRIYHGVWGAAPYQSLYEPAPGLLRSLPQMPEWHLLSAALTGFVLLGLSWPPLLLAAIPLAFTALASLLHAVASAVGADFGDDHGDVLLRWRRRAVTTALYLIQPVARLYGRVSGGLTPWRSVPAYGFALPWRSTKAIWTEHWRATEDRLHDIETALNADGVFVVRGGDFDRWDLAVYGGVFGSARLLMAVEEHGCGTQLVRIRLWPRWSPERLLPTVLLGGLALGAWLDGASVAAVVLGAVFLLGGWRVLRDTASACFALRHAAEQA
jgi:GT2 family glycosyltransferase